MGAPEGVGGEGGEESLSISRLLRNSGAPSAFKQIVHKSSSLYTLFHSAIYNSVPRMTLRTLGKEIDSSLSKQKLTQNWIKSKAKDQRVKHFQHTLQRICCFDYLTVLVAFL